MKDPSKYWPRREETEKRNWAKWRGSVRRVVLTRLLQDNNQPNICFKIYCDLLLKLIKQ